MSFFWQWARTAAERIDLAIAAGSRRAKTPKAVECEASQSGGAKTPHRPEQSA
jgi:hypothetical protein